MARLWPLCATCVLGACAGNGEGLDENGRPLEENSGVLQPTFQSIQEQVLTPVCTGCHAGASAPLGLRLDEGSSYALLVNAPSVEVPSLRRVQPGDPDASYLIQKISGTAAVGSRMPLNSPPLPADTIAVIRQWIADGAANNSATPGQKLQLELPQLTAISTMNDATLPSAAREIVIASNVELDTSLLQSDLITMRASGGDLASGNESRVPLQVIVRSQQPTVLAITPLLPALPATTYELRISGSEPVAIADMQGRVIDGDGNGTTGGDFVLRFTMEKAR